MCVALGHGGRTGGRTGLGGCVSPEGSRAAMGPWGALALCTAVPSRPYRTGALWEVPGTSTTLGAGGVGLEAAGGKPTFPSPFCEQVRSPPLSPPRWLPVRGLSAALSPLIPALGQEPGGGVGEVPACRPRLSQESLTPPDTLSQRHCQGPGRAPKWGPGHGPGGKWVGLAPATPHPSGTGGRTGPQPRPEGICPPVGSPGPSPPPPQAPTRRQTHTPANPHEAGEHLATAQVCALPLAGSQVQLWPGLGVQLSPSADPWCSHRAPWLAALRTPQDAGRPRPGGLPVAAAAAHLRGPGRPGACPHGTR